MVDEDYHNIFGFNFKAEHMRSSPDVGTLYPFQIWVDQSLRKEVS